METLYRIRDKFFPEQLPPAGTFRDRTVVVTGGTTGLGLAASVHFARLGAHVIITCRDATRGEAARRQIESEAGVPVGQPSVEVMQLDMNRYSSCVEFVEALKKRRPPKPGGCSGCRVDCVVLSAGCMKPQYIQSPEGWEEMVQVNTLSTVLLGLLLLPWMKTQVLGTSAMIKPHLVFVASRDHVDPDTTHWAKWAAEGGILQHCNDPATFQSPANFPPNYANSKLMLMYAVEEIAKLALGDDARPQVIVNSACPGLVGTDIARPITSQSWQMKAAARAYFGVLGKSADYGARTYVAAANGDETYHGRFIISLYTEEQYKRKAAANLTSAQGREVQALVWKEIVSELMSKVPALQSSLGELGAHHVLNQPTKLGT